MSDVIFRLTEKKKSSQLPIKGIFHYDDFGLTPEVSQEFHFDTIQTLVSDYVQKKVWGTIIDELHQELLNDSEEDDFIWKIDKKLGRVDAYRNAVVTNDLSLTYHPCISCDVFINDVEYILSIKYDENKDIIDNNVKECFEAIYSVESLISVKSFIEDFETEFKNKTVKTLF